MQSIKYIKFIILTANPKESSKSESKAPEKMSETKEKHTKESPDSKEKRGSTSTGAVPVSFPALPSTTTDSVRLKCRELLCTAIKGDGLPVDGRNNNWQKKII
jgi:transcription elongation factor S-II